MIELSLDVSDLRREMEQWSAEFGETSEQALYRLSARTAAWTASLTDPPSKAGRATQTKKKIEGAIWGGIRESTVVLPKHIWTFTRRMREPRVRWDGIYFKVHRNQFTMDAGEVNRHIDQKRGGRAHPSRQGVLQRKIIPDTTLRKLTAGRGKDNRLRRAGMAKGGWVGAGQEVQRWVKWGERRPLGKEWLGWTHKWAHKGSAYRRAGLVVLRNSAPYVGRVTRQWAVDRALDRAWIGTVDWYKAAVKRLDEKR